MAICVSKLDEYIPGAIFRDARTNVYSRTPLRPTEGLSSCLVERCILYQGVSSSIFRDLDPNKVDVNQQIIIIKYIDLFY